MIMPLKYAFVVAGAPQNDHRPDDERDGKVKGRIVHGKSIEGEESSYVCGQGRAETTSSIFRIRYKPGMT